VKKVVSLDGITKYRKILDAVKENVKTDLTWDDMIDIQSKYLSSFQKIESEQLQGSNASIAEIYYQILDPESLFKVQTKLRKQLGLTENSSERDKDLAFYNKYSYSITDGTAKQYGTSNYSDAAANSYTDPNAAYTDPNGTGEGQYTEQAGAY